MYTMFSKVKVHVIIIYFIFN